jgi:predicted permease
MDIVWHLDLLRQDLRQAFRALPRSRGFAAAVIVVTALGVGATTAVFTLADYVLLRPLPFPESDRLVKILQGSAARPASLRGLRGTNDVSPALYLAWKATPSFAAMGAYGLASANLSGSGEPERLDGAVITADVLEVLGIAPAAGRALTRDDDTAGAPCRVLISDGLWRRRFGADRSILGNRVRLDDEPCEVVGVMPGGFNFPARTTTFWRPARFAPDDARNFGNRFLTAIARLRADWSFDQARAALATRSASLAPTWPPEFASVAPVMMQLRDEITDQSRMLLFALTGAAACLLLIACTNLASLTLARSTARARELAVRTALGAGRGRLIRQLLTESLVLTVVGGVLGAILGIVSVPTAARLVPTQLPVAEVPGVDMRLLIISAIATLGTTIGFAVLPAFRAARRAGAGDLRDSSRTGTSRSTSRLRDALVIVQVSVSIVLLMGTGLLLRALVRVQSTPTGFTPDRAITVRTLLPFPEYGLQARRDEFYRRVIHDVTALPGVTAAAYTSYLPMTMRGGVWDVTVPGREVQPGRIENASARFITPAYFRAMEIPLVAGRPFDESDASQSEPVAIVSQSFVTSYLDGQQAIGRMFQFGPAGRRTIVGVVGDVRVRGLESRSEPQVYLPSPQQGDNRIIGYFPKDLVVRVSAYDSDRAALDALLPAIRQIVWNVDPDQAVSDARPLGAIVEGETVTRAVQVRVLGVFAATSCVLAAVGLHGLLAFIVSARAREFGVRLALGAEPRQVLALVARRGLMLGGAGGLLGLWIAYVAGRGIESLLAGLSPADAATLTAALGCALVMTLAGSLLPALRAARTNPRDAMQID